MRRSILIVAVKRTIGMIRILHFLSHKIQQRHTTTASEMIYCKPGGGKIWDIANMVKPRLAAQI